ncbi:hypothetical protein F5884DRAFT_247560 [Xylogone sp. PMI_703]|nr:hypothetical protein F5884DRAFT_247560 [Xylogone sp. PMI_703]
MSSEGQFACPICHQAFGRVEHLQRHLNSHWTTTRPFVCTHCGKSYRRRDVLVRHRLTCTARPVRQRERSSLPISRPPRRSTRRACDRCVRQKRACSSSSPCNNCAAHNQPCTYPAHVLLNRDRITSNLQLLEPTADDLGVQSQAWQQEQHESNISLEETLLPLPWDHSWSDEAAMNVFSFDNPVALWVDRDPTDRFNFLMQFSSGNGLVETFIDPGVMKLESNHVYCSQPDINSWNVILQPQPQVNCADGQVDHQCTSMPRMEDSLYDDPLTMKTMEICSGIKRVLLSKTDNSTIVMEWTEITEGMARQFFCPANLRAFVDLYWKLWQPNWPCIHRPSFQYATTLPTLLASMALMGARLSSRSSDREKAHIWFDIIEEMVFSDKYTSGMAWGQDPLSISAKSKRRQQLQILQAANIVCMFQNWDGNDTAQSRIRRSRFNTVVAMIRNLDIPNARHHDMRSMAENNFSWEEFIYTEEKIRLILLTYLLDAAFVTWNNHPPRMILCELQMGLVHPESCFQAESSSKCFQNIKYWHSLFPQRPDECFYSVLQAFCRNKMNEVDLQRFAYTALLNFWAIVKAFQIIIFHNHVMISSETQFEPVQNGMNNWRAVWNRRFLNGDDDSFDIPIAENVAGTVRVEMMEVGRQLGFWRHAAEYWLLTRLILKRMLSSSDGVGIEAEELTGEVTTTSRCGVKAYPFAKYDQSSPIQVMDFIRSGMPIL